jgi:thymidine kinase
LIVEGARTAVTIDFLKSLGFPSLKVHSSFNHFDFVRPGRRILVIGPMGSGKTEYSSRVWRDATVASKKTGEAARCAMTGRADRRRVAFVRSALDGSRFPDYPKDALAYRTGFDRLGERLVMARDSFELEKAMASRPEEGTWVVDEASFFDERLAYLALAESERRGIVFIFPTLILNFRREIFNATARLLLETATDVFPLTAYCEDDECLADSFYTYRFYHAEGGECPAPYFDPLIIVGGDRAKRDSREPDYCTRCDAHHYLPGKEYSFLTLKPLGREAASGNMAPLLKELAALDEKPGASALGSSLREHAPRDEGSRGIYLNAMRLPCLAERALVFLYAEQNLLSEAQALSAVRELSLDEAYLASRLADNGRPLA